jgi:hypothetical protein
LGDWIWEDWGLKPSLANSSWDPTSKITRAKWSGNVAQVVECLWCRHEILSSNPNPTKRDRERESVTSRIQEF